MEFINRYMRENMKINPSRVIENLDEIADHHDNLREVSDAMESSNAWLADGSQYENEVESYLNDDDVVQLPSIEYSEPKATEPSNMQTVSLERNRIRTVYPNPLED